MGKNETEYETRLCPRMCFLNLITASGSIRHGLRTTMGTGSLNQSEALIDKLKQESLWSVFRHSKLLVFSILEVLVSEQYRVFTFAVIRSGSQQEMLADSSFDVKFVFVTYDRDPIGRISK